MQLICDSASPYPSPQPPEQLPHRELFITIAQTDNTDADITRLKRVFAALGEFPGEDSVHLAIKDATGVTKLDMPHIATGYCIDLRNLLISLVGEQGIEITP